MAYILKDIKGCSARSINRLSGETGTLVWQDESFDHVLRSEERREEESLREKIE